MRFHDIRCRQAAFTLVELLVVIGVIAVLISILLPALNKARDSAQKVKCLSNMRQAYNETLLYANLYNGAVPVGYHYADRSLSNYTWISTEQYSYTDSVGQHWGGFTCVGWLYYSGFMKTPEIWWCPKKTPSNLRKPYAPASDRVWPPGNVADHWTTKDGGWSNGSFRVGHYGRPIVAWTAYNVGSTGKQSTAQNGKTPRIDNLKACALFAESLSSNPDQIPHRSGMNVVYADGSGVFVNSKAYIDNLRTANAFNAANNDTAATPYYIKGSYPTATGVWGDLDRAH